MRICRRNLDPRKLTANQWIVPYVNMVLYPFKLLVREMLTRRWDSMSFHMLSLAC